MTAPPICTIPKYFDAVGKGALEGQSAKCQKETMNRKPLNRENIPMSGGELLFRASYERSPSSNIRQQAWNETKSMSGGDNQDP